MSHEKTWACIKPEGDGCDGDHGQQPDASRWEERARQIAHRTTTMTSRGDSYLSKVTAMVMAHFAQVAADELKRGYNMGYEDAEDDLGDVHAAGVAEGLEKAALESESWMTLFNFDSFGHEDIRRCANPNQIAARIRNLKSPSKEPKP